MTATPWYRGPWTDWLRAAVIGSLAALGGWLYYYTQDYTAASNSAPELGQFVAAIPWQQAVMESAPYAVALVPIVVLAIRWYLAGEPLPDTVTNRPYTVYLVGFTALQFACAAFAWSIWGYTLATGQEMQTVLLALPDILYGPLAMLLFLGLTVGMFGPAIAMYLDARYVGERSLLDAFGAPHMLLWFTFLGIQFAGIPTVLATYRYLSRRDRTRVDYEVLA